MQHFTDTTDLSARIARVQAVGAAFDELRLDLVAAGGRGGDIVADTGWKSPAFAAYEHDVGQWQAGIGALAHRIGQMHDDLQAIVGRMLLAELQRTTQPGMPVPR